MLVLHSAIITGVHRHALCRHENNTAPRRDKGFFGNNADSREFSSLNNSGNPVSLAVSCNNIASQTRLHGAYL